MNDGLQDMSSPETKPDDLSVEELSILINKKIAWLRRHYLTPLLTDGKCVDVTTQGEPQPHVAEKK